MITTAISVSRMVHACSLALCVACASSPESPAPARSALEAAKSGATACSDAIPEALAEGHVRIRPGQNLCLKLEIDGSTVRPVSVVSHADPVDVLVVKSWKESGEVFLEVHNPLSAPLKYRAGMRLPGETGYGAPRAVQSSPDSS